MNIRQKYYNFCNIYLNKDKKKVWQVICLITLVAKPMRRSFYSLNSQVAI